MIKKIISVILALSIALSCLCVPSFAASGASDDVAASIGQYYVYLDQYLKGEITYEAFQAKSRAAFEDIKSDADRTKVQQILDGLTSAMEGVSYAGANISAVPVKVFRDTMKQLDDTFGFWDNVGGMLYDTFEGLWNEFANRNGYTDSEIDMNGYGACLRVYNVTTHELAYEYFGSLGILKDRTDNSIKYSLSYSFVRAYKSNGELNYSREESSSIAATYYFENNNCEFIGNWNYENADGTSIDDILTPNGISPKDIDDLPDDTDLSDFFKDLLDKLKNLFPDLSTIEGLLRAILAKCTSIDERLENGGSGLKPSELQTMLDQAVLALTLSNKSDADKISDTVEKSNDELLKELINIRKILQGFDSDEEVDDDTANSILQGLISGLTSGLISLIGSGLGDVEVSEIIEICSSAGTVGTKLLSGIVDVIALLGTIVPFSMIKTLLESVYGVIFNKNTPADLTFTLDGNSYSFLSASFLEIPIVAGSLQIIKGVVALMILYTWLKWARKFYISLM